MVRREVMAAVAGIGLIVVAQAACLAAQGPGLGRPAAGQPTNDPGRKPTIGRQDGDFGKVVAQSVAAVVVILALGVVALVVVKRFLPRFGVTQGRRIHVVETVYLGPRRSLHLVRIGERALLIGGTNDGLSLVSDLTGFVSLDETGGKTETGKRPKFTIPGLKRDADEEGA